MNKIIIPDDKKEIIADAFQKHFNHFGFKKTSVDDISRELKISKKTIYQHFSSKEKVYYYIISRFANNNRDWMEKKLNKFNSTHEKIEQLIIMLFSHSRSWLKENDSFEFKNKYEIARLAFQEAYSRLIKKLITEGIEAKEFKPVNIDVTALFIQGIISESMKMLNSNPKLKIENDVIDSIFKLLK